jgi:hypothetical protein
MIIRIPYDSFDYRWWYSLEGYNESAKVTAKTYKDRSSKRFLQVSKNIPELYSYKKPLYISIGYKKYDQVTVYSVYNSGVLSDSLFNTENLYIYYVQFDNQEDAMMFFLEHGINPT